MRPYVIQFPSFPDDRGTLVPVDPRFDLPFEIKRVFWVQVGYRLRGRHAHRTCKQVLVAVVGQIAVTTWGKDIHQNTTVLDKPDRGLVIFPEVFVAYSGMPGSVLLVLCSEPWDPDDLIQERSEPI